MDIKPLLEALASLETACRDAVDCLNVLAENSGPEFGNLEKLQKLFGGDGEGGLRKSIRQLCGIVGHCLNVDMPHQTHRLEVLVIKYQDVVDGTVVTTDELYVPGSKPYEINAANSIEALTYLLDESRASLNRAICKADGGGLIEWVCAEKTGRPLVDDAWRRLNDNWDAVTKEVEIPKGLDLSLFHKLVSEEIKTAKHLLTFGRPLPASNGVTPEVSDTQPRPKRKGRKRKVDPLEADILRVHQERQSHAETAAIANVRTPDGRLDTQRVKRVLKAANERKRRKRSTK